MNTGGTAKQSINRPPPELRRELARWPPTRRAFPTLARVWPTQESSA